MEGHGHDTVSQVKGLLDTITMVNVDVNVQNPWVVSVTHTLSIRKREANTGNTDEGYPDVRPLT